jgi:hypothetical protein
MAVQIQQPKKENPFSKILPVVGAIGAGVAAIPTGGASLAAIPAIVGAAGAGASLGGMAGGMLDGPQASNVPTSPAERRLNKMGGAPMPQAEDPREVLQKSMFALRDYRRLC